jgi:hypothetical protein
MRNGALWRNGEKLVGTVKGWKGDRGGPQGLEGMRRLRSNLTDHDVRTIRARLAVGVPRLELAREYQLSKGAIDRIATRTTFDWVPDDATSPAVAPINYSAAGVAKARQDYEAQLARDMEASVAMLAQKIARGEAAAPSVAKTTISQESADRAAAFGAGGLAFKVAPG